MGTLPKKEAAWSDGLFCRPRYGEYSDVEGTWTWAILGSITTTGQEDCPDRCSQKASRRQCIT